MSVELTEEGLIVDGEPCPLYSGAVQYWRLEPELWEAILDRIVELGFSMIEVYLPWGFHEPKQGVFDFAGKLDAGRFLDLAHARKLKVIARPGPHTNAEVTGFGYPDWVLEDPDCLARGSAGSPAFVPAPPRMFPMPSYAGDALYEHCAGYLDRVCEVLTSRQWPDGPVVIVQPDNEMAFFFRTAAFDVDYSPASLAAYRRFLKRRYRSVDKLERAYGHQSEDFESLDPPTHFGAQTLSDLPPYLDWCEYREEYLRDGVLRVARMLKERGLDRVPTTHNIPLGSIRSPFDLPAMEEKIDLVGIDMYYRKSDHRSLKARCLELSGASRFAYAPEFASGGYQTWPPMDLADQTFCTLSAMMNGVRGFGFYMLVDRERWYGAPIRRDGSLDLKRYEFFKRVLSLAARLGSAKRLSECLLLTTRLYGRLINLHNVLDPLSPMAISSLGFETPDWVEHRSLGCAQAPAASLASLHEELFDALAAARLGFDVGEPDRPAGNLARYKLAILPTADLLARRDAERLLLFVRSGGCLAFGPVMPCLDERGRGMHLLARALKGAGETLAGSAARLWRLGAGTLFHLPELLKQVERQALPALAADLLLCAQEADCSPVPDPRDAYIEAAVHLDAGTGWLWLANPTERHRRARLDLRDVGALVDGFSAERFEADPEFLVPMPAWSVRPLEILP